MRTSVPPRTVARVPLAARHHPDRGKTEHHRRGGDYGRDREAEARMTNPIHAALARRALLPAEHYLDSGLPVGGTGPRRSAPLESHAAHPVAGRSLQAGQGPGAGYNWASFTIDFDTQQASCPQGRASTWWTWWSPAPSAVPTPS
ncbi:MAG: hypothetical protein WKF73_18095 [Nocardioidaceae bacterium]